jgi:hypothetical protein
LTAAPTATATEPGTGAGIEAYFTPVPGTPMQVAARHMLVIHGFEGSVPRMYLRDSAICDPPCAARLGPARLVLAVHDAGRFTLTAGRRAGLGAQDKNEFARFVLALAQRALSLAGTPGLAYDVRETDALLALAIAAPRVLDTTRVLVYFPDQLPPDVAGVPPRRRGLDHRAVVG